MKKERIIKIIIIILISFVLLYFVSFWIQNIIIKKNIDNYILSFQYNVENIKKRDVVRCNYNILRPEFAEVELENRNNRDILYISFWKGDILFRITKENWRKYKVGGTTISNTTFPQLLAMVKEDCYQFQKSNNWYNKESKEIKWNWSRAETKEEREKRELERKEEEKKQEEFIKKLKEEGKWEEFLKEKERRKKLQDEVLKEYGF